MLSFDDNSNYRVGGGPMRTVKAIVYMISLLFEKVASGFLLFMMLIGVTDVLFRIMRIQFIGAYEWTGFACGIVISFAIPMVFWHRGHIFLDIVYLRFPKEVQHIWIIVLRLITGATFFLIGWHLFRLGGDYLRNNSVSYDTNFPLPLYYFAWAMACACEVVCVVMIYNIVAILKGESHD